MNRSDVCLVGPSSAGVMGLVVWMPCIDLPIMRQLDSHSSDEPKTDAEKK